MDIPAVARGPTFAPAKAQPGDTDCAVGKTSADTASSADLTGGRAADGCLQETVARNQQLLAIVNSLPGAAYRYVRTADGKQSFAFISDRAAAICAIPAEELRQNASLLFAAFLPADRARLEMAMNQPTPWLMPVDTELQIRARDGAERWVRLTARPTVLPGGDVAWDGIILDVDEDVRRRLSHDLLATAVEHAGDAIEITDPQIRLQYVNPAFERTTGYSRAEVIGRTPGSMLRSGHFDDAYYESIGRTISAGKVWRGDLIARHKDGAIVYQEATISPIVDSSGAIDHYVAVKRDVSARREAAAALEQARTLLADAIESISEGLVLFDADDRVILYNGRYLETYPFLPRDGLKGMSFGDLARIGMKAGVLVDDLARTDPEAWIAERTRLHRDPREHAIEQQMSDGRWIRITERRTAAGGIVGVYADITELKRREAAVLQAKEAAEIANQAKSTFLATMSHELRTPLNAVIGFAELISMQVNGPIANEHYLEYARDIRSSGEHLLTLINDILDLSRIEAGAVELGEDHVDCRDLIDYCVRLVRDRAQRAGLSLTVDAGVDVPELRGDQRKLRQALLNLLSNAIKFTPTGGSVKIAAACEADGAIILRVADNGIGMEPADIPEALTPFKQVDNSLARKYEGTGLGLPLAKSLIELHGGSLKLISELGGGTTVICRLPPSRTVSR